MAIQFDTLLRNARLDVIESHVGPSPTLRIRTGAQPSTCATADAGTVLSEVTLPSDWLAAAASGAIAKSGTWSDTSADAPGTAAHFRLYTSGGVCKMQGSITSVAIGTGDMLLDNVVLAAGQAFTVATWQLTDGNA
jgi:hypothetical protein